MKTEFDYGREYAQDQRNRPGNRPVDIDQMITGSRDIPDGDYAEMRASGIENPDPRKYWEGYNSIF